MQIDKTPESYAEDVRPPKASKNPCHSTLAAVLTNGGRPELFANLNGLAHQSFQDFDLLVIDNSPGPKTERQIAAIVPNAEYAAMRENLNRAGGFSWAINYATMKNYHYLWLMEDDTVADVNALENFERTANQLNNRFSFFSPSISDAEGNPCSVESCQVEPGVLADRENIRHGVIKLSSGTFISCFINVYASRHAGLPYREFICGAEDWEYTRRLSTIEPGYFIVSAVVTHNVKPHKTEITNCPEPYIGTAARIIRNKTWLYHGTPDWDQWEKHLKSMENKIRHTVPVTRAKRLKALRQARRDGLRLAPLLVKSYAEDYESLYSAENRARIREAEKADYRRFNSPLSLIFRKARAYAKGVHDSGRHTLLYPPCRFAAKMLESYLDKKFERDADRRRRGCHDPRFEKLRRLKDAYLGKRCFVCATGPSMTIADLEKLKDEYTLGVNSICMIYPQTDWRPSFYGISDRLVYKNLKSLIETHDILTFVGTNAFERENALPPDWILFPENYVYHAYCTAFEDDYRGKFSDDCYAAVYDCYTIVLNMIQILFYMGFREIYLLGCDCNYVVGAKNHFIENGHVIPDRELETAYLRLMAGYQALKDHADAHPELKVFNATRGGKLELFPRKSLEEVLATPKP